MKEERIPIVLVGNFADQEKNRKVFKERAKEAAMTMEIPYFETIATDQNPELKEMFGEIIREVYFVHKAKLNGGAPMLTPHLREVKNQNLRFSRMDSAEIKFSHNKATATPAQQGTDGTSGETLQYPQIKSATLEKLVERLTYEKYSVRELCSIYEIILFNSFLIRILIWC
jgi:hypothetical protein